MVKTRPAECPRSDLHHPDEPTSYSGWHAWAQLMSATHQQKRCPSCGLYKIWVPRAKTSTGA